MKVLSILACMVFSVNAMAIEFITEAQVRETLSAENVIEISKHSPFKNLQDSPCGVLVQSRSARAYVVKKADKVDLYMTDEGLAGLTLCLHL